MERRHRYGRNCSKAEASLLHALRGGSTGKMISLKDSVKSHAVLAHANLLSTGLRADPALRVLQIAKFPDRVYSNLENTC